MLNTHLDDSNIMFEHIIILHIMHTVAYFEFQTN